MIYSHVRDVVYIREEYQIYYEDLKRLEYQWHRVLLASYDTQLQDNFRGSP